MVLGIINWFLEWCQVLASQPSAPSTFIIVGSAVAMLCTGIIVSLFFWEAPDDTVNGVKIQRPLAERIFRVYTRWGRLRNLLCSPCDRIAKRYPVANTCQIPHFTGRLLPGCVSFHVVQLAVMENARVHVCRSVFHLQLCVWL